MAHIYVSVTGNTDFGGYLTIGGNEIKVYDTYAEEISNGNIDVILYSKSRASRDLAQGLGAINNLKTSGGFFMDMVQKSNEKTEENYRGEAWGQSYTVEEDDIIIVAVKSEGEDILDVAFGIESMENEEYREWVEKSEFKSTVNRMKRAPTAFWLCVFLGWLSAHRFYLNQKRAFIYLITAQLFGIGWIIDFVSLLRDYIAYRKIKKEYPDLF